MQDTFIEENKKHDAGSIRELLAVALPMVASSTCETLMTFTDRLFLSRLGPHHMSAATGGGITCMMMGTFFIGLTGYCSALVAQHLGGGQKDKCARVITQGLLICLLAYPLILLCRPFGPWLFQASGIAPEQLEAQTMYFNILLYGIIITLLRNTLSCFFSGIGKTRVVMFGALTAMVVNIGVNYVLIFGKCGFPALGIRGAAYGTIIGSLCGTLILLAAYLTHSNRKAYCISESLRFDRKIMKTLLRFGSPAGLEFFLNFVAFSAMVMIFHACGAVIATATTITLNWDLVTFLPLIGVEIAVTSLVGRYMGAGKPEIAHRVTMSGLKLGWCYSLLILLPFVGCPDLLVDTFRPLGEDAIFTQAEPLALFMVRLVAVYIMAEAVFIVFSGALRGAGDTFWAMCISVGLHWLLVPVLYVMLHVLGTSPEAAWVALIVLFIVFSGLFYLRYRSGNWKKIRVIHAENEEPLIPHDGFHETADL